MSDIGPTLNDPESGGTTSEASGTQVYVIPQPGQEGSSRPQILVLPYVPLPSTSSLPNASHHYLAPPPHYFQGYDPPPEYNSWVRQNPNAPRGPGGDLSTPCSCCTQETIVSQSASVYNLPRSVSEHQSGFFQTPTSLYPHFISSNLDQRDCRTQIQEDSETEYELPITDGGPQGADTLLVRRWVLILLVLGLLITASLLIGITLQHFQLMSQLKPEDFLEDEVAVNGTETDFLKRRPFMLPSLGHHL